MLVTLLEIKEFLKIKLDNDSEDSRLRSINSYVSSLIESYCGRVISSGNYTEYFNGGVSSVFIKNPPINSVHEVSHYTGNSYTTLGGPGSLGQQIEIEGSSHKITALGNAKTSKRVKQFGISSLHLAEAGDYLSVSSSDDFNLGTEPFTIELFVRPANLNNSTFISRNDNDNYNWELSYDTSDGVFFRAKSDDIETAYISGTTLPINTFTHIAVVKEDTELKIYQNGNQVGSSIAHANSIPNLSSSLEVGRISQTDNKNFIGYIDDIRVSWNAKYSSNFSTSLQAAASDEDTKLLIPFNEGANKTDITDFSRKVNEYVWYPDTGEVSFDSGMGSGSPSLGFFNPRKFNNFTNGVRVTYNGGYSSVPNDLKLASLEMIKVLYKGREGAKSVSLQGDNSSSHDLSLDGFPPQVRRVLNLYRLPM